MLLAIDSHPGLLGPDETEKVGSKEEEHTVDRRRSGIKKGAAKDGSLVYGRLAAMLETAHRR